MIVTQVNSSIYRISMAAIIYSIITEGCLHTIALHNCSYGVVSTRNVDH